MNEEHICIKMQGGVVIEKVKDEWKLRPMQTYGSYDVYSIIYCPYCGCKL